MDFDEKLARKLVRLAYCSKKKRTRKKYKRLMFEMIQEQIEKAYLVRVHNTIEMFYTEVKPDGTEKICFKRRSL